MCSHHAKLVIMQFVGQKNWIEDKGYTYWTISMQVNYLVGTPDPPNLIAVIMGSIKFLCHGRLLVGLYLGYRRGSFRASVDHCRSFRLLITT